FLSSRPPRPPSSTLFPYTTLFRSQRQCKPVFDRLSDAGISVHSFSNQPRFAQWPRPSDNDHVNHKFDLVRFKLDTKFAKCHRGQDRKSTRLNSSHVKISYAVFCLK